MVGRIIVAFVVTLTGVALFCFLWFRRYSAPQIVGEMILSVPTSEKVIALTFDDGPNPPFTAQILDLLSQYNAKATFFVLGQNVQKHPEVAKAIFERGNELGNHSWHHSPLVFRSPRFIQKQIDSVDEAIRRLGYPRTIYFRAPYGRKLFALPYVLWKTSRQHILFNIVTGDWSGLAADKMLEALDEQLTNGSIVLLHDGDSDNMRGGDCGNTVELVELILKRYTTKEYKFVTISELLSYRAEK